MLPKDLLYLKYQISKGAKAQLVLEITTPTIVCLSVKCTTLYVIVCVYGATSWMTELQPGEFIVVKHHQDS